MTRDILKFIQRYKFYILFYVGIDKEVLYILNLKSPSVAAMMELSDSVQYITGKLCRLRAFIANSLHN